MGCFRVKLWGVKLWTKAFLTSESPTGTVHQRSITSVDGFKRFSSFSPRYLFLRLVLRSSSVVMQRCVGHLYLCQLDEQAAP